MTTGRLPVQNFLIETISNILDPRLLEFRKEIFANDLNLDPNLIIEDKPHKWWLENFDKKIAEDAYKYCDRKWNTIGFDCIEAIIEDGKIVGISGAKKYNSYLRTSMHLYLLKRVRKKYIGIKYIKDGWFHRHINYARASNCKGLFFTIYAYSPKLKGLLRNHTEKTISYIDKSYLLYIDDVKEVGEYIFNNVPQTFFYYPLDENIFEIKEILNDRH